MPAPKIRGHYDELSRISQMFSREASDLARVVQAVNRQMETLKGGEWIGTGAIKFYREMDSEVMPSLARLARAMDTASKTTRAIKQILQTAEEEAASVLRLIIDGSGAAGVSAGGGAGAGAGGGAGAAAEAIQGNALLARDPRELFQDDFMRSMIGREFQGAGSEELARVMDGLMDNPQGDELDGLLQDLADIRGRPITEIQIEFRRFQELQQQQQQALANNPELEPPEQLGGGGGGGSDHMGSNLQMRYGSVVGEAFGVDPAFGAMLNPTGGLLGPGMGPIHTAADAAGMYEGAVGYHGVFHDAAGYMYNYHGQVGPGYNYLGQDSIPTDSFISGQAPGIAHWRGLTGDNSWQARAAQWVTDEPLQAWHEVSTAWDSASDLASRARDVF